MTVILEVVKAAVIAVVTTALVSIIMMKTIVK